MNRQPARVLLIAAILAGSVALPTAPAFATVTPGTVTNIVGGAVGDGGPATQALLKASGAAFGPDGSIYLADVGHNRIRLIATDGTISTVAGTDALTDGHGGFAGDGGLATAAELNQPSRVRVTPTGDLVILDRGNARVRRIDHATGVITTIAGNGLTGTPVASTDATSQPLKPWDIALDPVSGDVAIVDLAAPEIWSVPGDGSLSVLVGGGQTYPDNGEAATAAKLFSPTALAFMPNGDLLIAEELTHDIRRLSGGTVSTIAGLQQGAASEGSSALDSTVPFTDDLAVGADSTVYAGSWAFSVGGTLTALANAPCAGVADFSATGKVLVACQSVFLQQADGTFAEIAGFLAAGNPSDATEEGMAAKEATIAGPATTIGGDVYFIGNSAAGTATLNRVGSDGVVHRVAGTDGPATALPDEAPALSGPAGMGVLPAPDGGLFMEGPNSVRLITADGIEHSYSGTAPAPFVEGEPASALTYSGPIDAAASGDVYVAAGEGGLRVIRWSDRTVHTVVASLGALGGASYLIQTAQRVIAAPDGTVLVLMGEGTRLYSPENSRLLRIDPVTGQWTMLYQGRPLTDVVAANDGTVVVLTAPVAGIAGATPEPARVQVLSGDGSLTTIAGGGHRLEDTTTNPADFAAECGNDLGRGPGASVLMTCATHVVQITPPSAITPEDPVTGLAAQSQVAPDGSATLTATWSEPTNMSSDAIVAMAVATGPGIAPVPLTTPLWTSPAGQTTMTDYARTPGTPYRISAYVIGPDGSRSAPATVNVVGAGDTTPPPAPAFTAGLSVDTSAQLLWINPEVTDLQQVEVRVVQGTVAPASSITPSYVGLDGQTSLTGLVVGQTYTFTVLARDYGGNPSPVTGRSFIAGEAPQLVIVSAPAEGSWVKGTSVSITTNVDQMGGYKHCSLDSGPADLCADAVTTFTGLTSGKHTLEMYRANFLGESNHVVRTWYTDSTLPSVKMKALPAYTLRSTVAVGFAGTDTFSGISYYRAKYIRLSYSGAAAIVSPTSWQHLTTTNITLSLAAGYEYCVEAQAVDKVGNVSPWTSLDCTTRPLDDRALAASSGWARATASGYYLNTLTSTKLKGAKLTRSGTQFMRLALVATRCPTCGTVAIYSGTTLLKTVSLYASTTQRQWVYVLPQVSSRKADVSIRVTSTNKLVQIDGLGVSKYGAGTFYG